MSVMEAEDVVGQAYETIRDRVAAGTARQLEVEELFAGTALESASPAEAQRCMAALVDLARHETTDPDRPLSDRDVARRRLAWAVANRLYDQVRLVPGVTSRR